MAKKRQIVFLNYPLETFTPTKSGAIATIIWECCQVALAAGVEPWVITRDSEVSTFPWQRLLILAYPKVAESGPRFFLARLVRKLTGWRHLRQGRFARSVARAVRKEGLSREIFVIFNDPEWAIDLRKRFPGAFLLHWFQNQIEVHERYRARFCRAVDAMAACSQFTASWVESHLGLPTGRVQVVHNAVDGRHFAPSGEPVPDLPTLNFVGRTGIEKGPDLLLKAAILLAEAGHRFRVQIVGSNHWDHYEEDAYQRELNALVARLETLGVPVRRPGHVGRAALPAELHRAQIHVVPARWDEPFGMTTLEGMACGLATVAAATGGTPEVVGDGGLLFARESVEDLRACLARLLADADLRREFGKKARCQAERFTWQRTWTNLAAIAAQAPIDNA